MEQENDQGGEAGRPGRERMSSFEPPLNLIKHVKCLQIRSQHTQRPALSQGCGGNVQPCVATPVQSATRQACVRLWLDHSASTTLAGTSTRHLALLGKTTSGALCHTVIV